MMTSKLPRLPDETEVDLVVEWDENPTREIPPQTMRELVDQTKRRGGRLVERKRP